MAGTAASGFAAADPELFRGCIWVLGLEAETDLADWLTLARLYTALGTRVVPITAAEHDDAVASISHVPHLLAAALALELADSPLNQALAAGSFRDGTRVAATRAELTAAMCGGNAGPTSRVLDRVISTLAEIRADLEGADPVNSLLPLLHGAGEYRRAWPPAPGAAGRMIAGIHQLLELGRSGGWVTSVEGTAVSTMRPETDRYIS
jgi:prephenate dehydrogenase